MRPCLPRRDRGGMTMISTDRIVTTPGAGGPIAPVGRAQRVPAFGPPTTSVTPFDGRPEPPGKTVRNPVRISRIGADHLQVFIRPVDGDQELLALVGRLEELIGAGYEVIDVVFERARRGGVDFDARVT